MAMEQATTDVSGGGTGDIDTGTGIVISTIGLTPGALEACSFGEMEPLFRVSKHTTYQWNARNLLPARDDHVSGRDLWHIRTLIRWGRQSGRTVYLHPDKAHRYLD